MTYYLDIYPFGFCTEFEELPEEREIEEAVRIFAETNLSWTLYDEEGDEVDYS